jgi:hypothetical protein
MAIPLSALPAPTEEVRRDRWGRYLVVPPGGTKPVGYTRVTTVAKALDNGGGLAPWKATLAVCGTIMRRGLRSQWEALMAATNGDPWYFGEQSKKECKRLVEECAEAGGSAERRDTGTSLHALTALVDLGRPPQHLTVESERDISAYSDTLEAAGVTVVPGMVEVTVVLDDKRVGGTFDRGYQVPGFERPLVGDLKCGADLSYSWQAIAVQLAAYAHGDDIYRQGRAADGSEDERLPMPDFDQESGLIVWLNAGTGRCELFVVDLVAGWEAFQVSLWAREWRKTDVAVSLADHKFRPSGDDIAPLLEASLAVATAGGGPGGAEPPPDTGAAATADHTPAVRAWLQGRIDLIGSHDRARIDLGLSWPAGLPGLLATDDHTATQLQAIEDVLWAVEKRHGLVFPEPKPGVDLLASVLTIFPNSTDVTDSKEANP